MNGAVHVNVLADNIVSPLGLTSRANLEAVLAGRSGVRLHCAGTLGNPEPFAASLLDREEMEQLFAASGICGRYSFLEKLAVLSAAAAVEESGIDPSDPDTVFVFSSTKGNVGNLGKGDVLLHESARRLAEHFGNGNDPVVISNACISGVCAELVAMRALRAGRWRRAVVTGVDCLSPFIISGFQSFRALSAEPCRPFDSARCGLNLGEAAATVVLEACGEHPAAPLREILGGCVRNDANHISGPSRTGEGSFLCLDYLLGGDGGPGLVRPEELAAVNLHGTATAYNDEMESIALSRAGLSGVPANSLKGFFGHTLGAAGVLETIMSMHAVERGLVLPTLGFENLGVSCPVNVSAQLRQTDRRAFIKLISGFGGCNAAVAFRLGAAGAEERVVPEEPVPDSIRIKGRIDITPGRAVLDGRPVEIPAACGEDVSGRGFLTALYRSAGTEWPKFFKMDSLSRLGFMASELLLDAVEPSERFVPRKDRGVIFFNRSASLCNDMHYLKTISDPLDRFPSPALFVYTLPNIVCGEIAIRNRWYGETMFFISDGFDGRGEMETVCRELCDRGMESALCGWVECADDDNYEAHVFLVEKNAKNLQ